MSCVVDSSVTGYSLIRGWWWCEASIGSVALRLECVAPNSTGRAGLYKHVTSVDWLVSVDVCHYLLFGCLLWYQSPLGVVVVGGGGCKLWPASVCLSLEGKKRWGGTKCSSVPKAPPPSRSVRSLRALVLEMRSEWGISPTSSW